jgi:hypothetical protein
LNSWCVKRGRRIELHNIWYIVRAMAKREASKWTRRVYIGKLQYSVLLRINIRTKGFFHPDYIIIILSIRFVVVFVIVIVNLFAVTRELIIRTRVFCTVCVATQWNRIYTHPPTIVKIHTPMLKRMTRLDTETTYEFLIPTTRWLRKNGNM